MREGEHFCFDVLKAAHIFSGVCFEMMHSCIAVQIHSPLAAAELAEPQWIASGPDAFGCRLSLKNRSKRSN